MVVPEAIILVGSLLAGHGLKLAVITAVFLCSMPEAMFATHRLRRRGVDGRAVMVLWAALTLISGVTAAVTYGLLRHADGRAVAFVLALAGGCCSPAWRRSWCPRGE